MCVRVCLCRQLNQRMWKCRLKMMGKVMVCQRCKWKSAPCVLHFNLTSFHSRPNHYQQNEQTRTRLWHLMLSRCMSFLYYEFHSPFPPVTTINHIVSPFLRPNPKGKTNDKTHSHLAKEEGYIFYFYFFTSYSLMFMLVLGGNVLSWNEGKGKESTKKKIIATLPSNDREIH